MAITVKKAFKILKPEEFSAYRRSAGEKARKNCNYVPTNSNVTLICGRNRKSRIRTLTHTNDDILDILEPEIRRVDSSIQSNQVQ